VLITEYRKTADLKSAKVISHTKKFRKGAYFSSEEVLPVFNEKILTDTSNLK